MIPKKVYEGGHWYMIRMAGANYVCKIDIPDVAKITEQTFIPVHHLCLKGPQGNAYLPDLFSIADPIMINSLQLELISRIDAKQATELGNNLVELFREKNSVIKTVSKRQLDSLNNKRIILDR